MAEKRMFTKKITESDAFLDMPTSAQCLYFHLNMDADDDGFVNSPRRVMRVVGACEDDMKLLIAKSFLIPFDSGIVVIKHWWMHNTLMKDRYHETDYIEEKSMLTKKDNKAYTICYQDDNKLITENRLDLDKNRLNKNNRASNKFVPPTIADIKSEIMDKGYTVDAERFFNYYESVGWVIGKGKKMKSWKSALANWSSRERQKPSQDIDPQTINPVYDDSINRSLTEEELKELEELMKGRTNETN